MMNITSKTVGSLFSISFLMISLWACTGSKKIKAGPDTGYSPVSWELFQTIARQDSLLFVAFNSRDMKSFKEFFADTLRIYQDDAGVRTYDQAMASFDDLFHRDYVLHRELVKGSMEVYPVKGYGAIQTGRHTFCHTENGKRECGTFKFLHIWQEQNGKWKLTEIVTYNHKIPGGSK